MIPCSGAVSDVQVGGDVEFAAGQHDRDAVVADRAGDQHRVARLCTVATPSSTGVPDDADAGRVDVAAVGLAALHDLRVAGDDPHAGDVAAALIDAAIRCRSATGKPSSRIMPTRQVQRRRAGDRQVVDGAVDGQVADVAAGEEQRRDHVRVGRERQPRAVDRPSRAASSSGSSSGLRNCSRKIASISVCVALPPAPCASVIRSSLTRALAAGALVDAVEHLLLAVLWTRARLAVDLGVGHTCVASRTRWRLNRPKL